LLFQLPQMPRIILHIGLRKTGTTSIQKFLNKNHDILLKHDILYPRSGLPLKESVYAHHDLAVSITNIRPPTNKQCWQLLHEELEQHTDKLIFISSEIFSVATPEQIEQVRDEFKDHIVTALIYLRDPVNFMISLYKEQIKAHNESLSFRKFIRQQFSLVDYDELIKNWKTVFGDSNVILKNYDELNWGDQLIQNLLESLNLENYSPEFSFLDKANVSPEEKTLIVIRHLNLFRNILPLPPFLKNKILTDINDLNKGNDHGKLLLRRYSIYLPKILCSYHEIKWLESKTLSFGSEYRKNFQNNINLFHPVQEL
jgi:hypothetical protein